MAEALDRLSGGRLILGLGGGASDEFRAFGIGVPAPRDKVDGLAEAIEIIQGPWTEAALTYTGRIHHAVAAPMEPKPARRIPVWLGTFGPRAGRHRAADRRVDAVAGLRAAGPPAGMRDRVVTAVAAAGRSMDDITCALKSRCASETSGPA